MQSQNSADEMARSRGYAKGTAEIKQPDEKVPNPTSVQSQNSADGMGRSRGHAKGAEANRPDKKHVNPTSVNCNSGFFVSAVIPP